MKIIRRLLASVASRRPTRQPGIRSTRPPLGVESLDERVMLSATPLRLAVMGDSLSAPYPAPGPNNPPPNNGSAGDLSWVQQLQSLDGHKIVIDDEAFPGATSNSLLNSDDGHTAQVPAVVNLIEHHQVDAAVLLIGANDVDQDLPLLFTSPANFVSTFVLTVVANVETAAEQVAAAGHVKLVLGNVPDVTVTPGFQFAVPAAAIPVVEQAITLANQQIDAFAADHHIPVVNMDGLTHILNQPLTLGGVTVNNLYSPDFFHPNTVGQGVLGDTVLDALHEGYDVNVQRLRLSDQQILNEAHIAHKPGQSYFDVDPFVISTAKAHAHDCDFVRILEGLEHHDW
jgi:lysophospholipase L1-like esterase